MDKFFALAVISSSTIATLLWHRVKEKNLFNNKNLLPVK